VLRTVAATRYVTPLREGGSLPGLFEADDDGLYVVKLRAAGQGTKALVAEVLAGELARMVGLPVPEIVLVELDATLGRAEPDPEIRELVMASGGVNAGLDFLPGAFNFIVGEPERVDPELAADVVWFDALVMNVDRTPRNPNMLLWHGDTYLIDHGAAFYLQHSTHQLAAEAQRPFPLIRDHVLLPFAGPIADADARLRPRLAERSIGDLIAALPDDWLGADPAASRREYAGYLRGRLEEPRAFVAEAEAARDA
jgi:hypothetical protein